MNESLTVMYVGTGYSSSDIPPTNAGTYTASASYTASTNYSGSTDSKTFTINKATATLALAGLSPYTYDGTPKFATATTVPAGLSEVSISNNTGHTDAGTYPVTATLVNNNYEAVPVNGDLVIGKADADVYVEGSTWIYDGDPHGASALASSATGIGGVDLSSEINFGETYTNVPGGTAHWTFNGGMNYLNESGDVEIVILKVAADIVVTAYTGVYDGSAHHATGIAHGVKGEELTGLVMGASFTNVPGGTATWTFSNMNYSDNTGPVNVVITQADAVVNVSGGTFTYDALPHSATGTATGVGGVDLSSGLDFGASFTNVPGGTAHWTFTNSNYVTESGDVGIVINNAAANVSVTGGTFTYNAAPHEATGFAYGVGGTGDHLTPAVTFMYTGISTTYGPIAIAPTNAGTYEVTASFAGNGNYNAASGTATIIINRAEQVITWENPSNITYGTLLSTTELDATVAGLTGGSAGGTLTYIPAAGTLLAAGPHTLRVDAAETNNYNAAYKEVEIVVDKAPVIVTAIAGQNKVFGNTDPALFTYTHTALVGTDDVTGLMEREAGEDVGTYLFTLGSLTAGENYILSISATPTFSIMAMPITVTSTAGQTKVYGAAEPLVYTFTSVPAVGASLPNGSTVSFTGALSRVTGEDVGAHAIIQGDLGNSNYTITFVPANFTITAMPITVTADAGQTKVYGAANPVYTFTSVPAVGA